MHHYYPALYFGILVAGFLLDHLTLKLPKLIRVSSYGVAYTVVSGLFFYFSPISFGMTGPAKDYSYMKWFEKWRVCN